MMGRARLGIGGIPEAMAGDWITVQNWRILPSGSEEGLHNLPAVNLSNVWSNLDRRSSSRAEQHLRLSSTFERDSSYGPTTISPSVIEITHSRDHTCTLEPPLA